MVSVLVVDLFEVVDINEKENQITMVAAVELRSAVGAHGLAGVGLNHAAKKAAVADASERIAERGFLQFEVCPSQFSAALGDGPFQTFVLVSIPIPRPQDSPNQQHHSACARDLCQPSLPPWRGNRKRRRARDGLSRLSRLTGHLKGVVSCRQ